MFWTEQRTILQSTSPRTSAAYLCFSSFEPLIRKTSVHAPGCRLSACGFLPVLTSCPNRVFQVFDLPAFLSPTTATKSRSAIGDVPFWSALTILHWGFGCGFAAYFISREWVGGMCSQRLSAGLKSLRLRREMRAGCRGRCARRVRRRRSFGASPQGASAAGRSGLRWGDWCVRRNKTKNKSRSLDSPRGQPRPDDCAAITGPQSRSARDDKLWVGGKARD